MDRPDSETGTVTGDDCRDRLGVRHPEHGTGRRSAGAVQNRQDGQSGTVADSHHHLTGSVPDSVSGRAAQTTENEVIVSRQPRSFTSAYPYITDELAISDPEQLAESYGQVSSPDSGIVDKTRLTQSPARITSIFGNESRYQEPIGSAQLVSDEPSRDPVSDNCHSGYFDRQSSNGLRSSTSLQYLSYPYSSQGRPETELSREESGSILRCPAPTDNNADLSTEASRISPSLSKSNRQNCYIYTRKIKDLCYCYNCRCIDGYSRHII